MYDLSFLQTGNFFKMLCFLAGKVSKYVLNKMITFLNRNDARVKIDKLSTEASRKNIER